MKISGIERSTRIIKHPHTNLYARSNQSLERLDLRSAHQGHPSHRPLAARQLRSALRCRLAGVRHGDKVQGDIDRGTGSFVARLAQSINLGMFQTGTTMRSCRHNLTIDDDHGTDRRIRRDSPLTQLQHATLQSSPCGLDDQAHPEDENSCTWLRRHLGLDPRRSSN